MNKADKQVAEEGDLVMLYERKDSIIPLRLKKDEKYHSILGAFLHNDMIGKEYGSVIISQTGNRYMYLLRPTAELWAGTMKTRTQIIYTLDASVIIFNLFLRPGCRVVESGTGSGALSTDFARVLTSRGHLFTFEYNEMRANEARKEFELNGLSDTISVFHRDVYADGFEVANEENENLRVDADHPVDAVFLDLPKPYDAIDHACKVLRYNGRICCFSPCIEQVQENCRVMREKGFELIETVEVLLREYELNSIDNNNSGTTRLRNFERMQEAQRKREHEEEEEEMTPMEEEAKPITPMEEAKPITPMEEPIKEETPLEEVKQSTPLFVPPKDLNERINSMVLAKGEHIGRGHTAYLSFGTKL